MTENDLPVDSPRVTLIVCKGCARTELTVDLTTPPGWIERTTIDRTVTGIIVTSEVLQRHFLCGICR
jgi:hypothetical protein